MRLSTTCLLIVGAAFPGTVVSQGPVLPPPTRIRYSLPASQQAVVAQVLAQRGDTLWVQPERSQDTVRVLVPTLSHLDVSLGQNGHALRGAGIGFLSGAVVGGVGGLLGGDDPEGCAGGSWFCYRYTAGTKAVIYGSFLGLIGSGIGAIVGASHKTDRWEPVILTNIRASTGRSGSSVQAYQAGLRLTVF